MKQPDYFQHISGMHILKMFNHQVLDMNQTRIHLSIVVHHIHMEVVYLIQINVFLDHEF